MALTDYKITDSDITTNGITSQPNKMIGTAAQNKAAFDKLIKDVVKVKLNNLIDALVTALAGKMPAPESYGTAGQYMQTDGQGGVMWNTPTGAGDMLKSQYDTDNDGIVELADSASACSGLAARATKLATPRSVTIKDYAGNTVATGSFDGSANLVLTLAEDIAASVTEAGSCSGNCAGNAGTASAWATARSFTISDSDQSHTGASQSVSGAANADIRLPHTMKATPVLRSTDYGAELPDPATMEEGQMFFKVVS